jgi:hypothetical protein
MLYFTLSRRLPNGSTFGEIEARNHSDPPPRRIPVLDDSGADAREMDRICARAMAPTAAERYPSAAALADDLEAWARSEPIHWTRPSTARRVRLWMRRRPVIAVLAVLLLVATGVGSGGVWFWSSRAATSSAKLNAAKQQASGVADGLKDLYNGLNAHRKALDSRDVLLQLLILDAMNGESISGLLTGKPMGRPARIDAMRRWLSEAKAHGRAGDIEVLLYEEALGLWLLDSGQAAASEQVLRDLLPRMEASISSLADPFVRETRLLHAAAAVQMGATGESLADARRVLLDAPAFLRSDKHADPVVDQIRRACGKAGIPCDQGPAEPRPGATTGPDTGH